jgi:DNA-binding NarL/FixJ family response regulator
VSIRPQLLILAEPLVREGLLRLLGAEATGGAGPFAARQPYRLATASDALEGNPQLVIWSVTSSIAADSLLAELQHLRERFQPAALLLLLPGDLPLPESWLLQLPAEGLLQQAEPERILEAVGTLLDGGRVLELNRLEASPEPATDPEALGLGQWLLQSGLAQITAEQRRCRRWLELCDGGLSRMLLEGRLRELHLARQLLIWLWGPIALAFPSADSPADRASSPTARPPATATTAITLRQRTAVAVWETIQARLAAGVQAGLTNRTGQLLALEGLNPDHRRDLLLALLSQLDLLITRLRLDQTQGEELEQRWLELQPDLRSLSLRRMAGEYVQLPLEGGLLPVADNLVRSSDLASQDPDLPRAVPMLAALVLAQPIVVEGRLLAPDEPQAVLHLEALITNWLIRSAELISSQVLACCSSWPELRRYLLTPELLATRNLERLRNQLNAQQRWGSWFERPVQLYESQRRLYCLQAGAIVPIALIEPRDAELRRLGWPQQTVTLLLEARDALAPQLQSLLRRAGDLLVVLLTQVIGRAIGLVGRGILQGMGRSVGRG